MNFKGIILLIFIVSFSIGTYFLTKQSNHQHNTIPNTSSTEEKKHTSKEHVDGYAAVHIDSLRVQHMGIITEEITMRTLHKTIRSIGIVEVDETKKSIVQTKFKGWIEELYVNFTGMLIEKNQPLFAVYSPELLATQEELLLALQHEAYEEESKNYLQSLSQGARVRLELWQVPRAQIHALEKNKKPFRTLIINAPHAGIVLQKMAFIGMNVEPGMPIFTIADLSRVWIVAAIYEQDINLIKMNYRAKISITSLPDKQFEETITFINYVIDTPTRTAKIRFECDNQDYVLKPGMYATVNIKIPLDEALALPEEALIDTGKRKIVFVAVKDGHYEPREIIIGYKADSYYQVLDGLEAGEKVVTSAQFLIDSESRLKALTVMKNGAQHVGHHQ